MTKKFIIDTKLLQHYSSFWHLKNKKINLLRMDKTFLADYMPISESFFNTVYSFLDALDAANWLKFTGYNQKIINNAPVEIVADDFTNKLKKYGA
jgi:hypothetical protein